MPARIEIADQETWADIATAGQSRTLEVGRGQQVRGIYFVADWSVVQATAVGELASAAEVIGNVTLEYDDPDGGAQHIQFRGYDLYNNGIGFYRSQGVLGGAVVSEQYGDNPVATMAFRGAWRVPVGAPAAPGKINVTVDMAGEGAWAETVGNISGSGTLYLYADYAPSPYMFSCWNSLTAGVGTTPIALTPVLYGKYFMGLGAVLGITLGTWIANATADCTNNRGGSVAATNNYEDDLRSLEVKNIHTIVRADAPNAQVLFHSGRLLGILKQGEGTANIDGTSLKSWPSGHYWVEGDAQLLTDNFRVYISCLTATTDASVCVWSGTPVNEGSPPETKAPDAPVTGQPSDSVPIPTSSTGGGGGTGPRTAARVVRR